MHRVDPVTVRMRTWPLRARAANRLTTLAALAALGTALAGCAGTGTIGASLHSALYGYASPRTWLAQAGRSPWLRPRIPPSPVSASQAQSLENAATVQSQIDDLTWLTLGRSPRAQQARLAMAQMDSGSSLYVQDAPAYAILLITARRGDPQAQAHLGDLYAHEAAGTAKIGYAQPLQVHPGLVPILRAQAVIWTRRAAAQGLDDAQVDFDLGSMWQQAASPLIYGSLNPGTESTPVSWPASPTSANDNVQAAYWYRRAAMQGDATAAIHLADLERLGAPGIPIDLPTAFSFYRMAARRGQPYAQYRLALAYRYGTGTTPAPAKYAAWLARAATAKWPAAENRFAHRLIRPLLAAARRGNVADRYQLGLAYFYGSYRGLSMDKDPPKAAYWFQQAAVDGHALAQYYLGWCYQIGRGVAQNDRRAAYWYELSARHGNGAAANNVGTLLQQGGPHLAANPILAAKWYAFGAHHGSAQAATNLRNLLIGEAASHPGSQTERRLARAGGISPVQFAAWMQQESRLQQARAAQQQSAEAIAAQAATEAEADPVQDDAPPPDPGGGER